MRFVWLGIFAFSILTMNANVHAKQVDASMIANVSAVKPGEPFDIGVRLKMTAGWHTYWSNPGDAGLATRVQWKLPAGFQAGELQFPVPTQFNEPGGLIVYGYENEVMLVTRITPPSDLKIGEAITISGKAKWLCCAAVCVPGSADLSLTLDVADHAKAANAAAFDLWKAHSPVPSSASATALHLTEDHPHSDLFVPRILAKDDRVIPSAVDGLVVEIGSGSPAGRNGVNGTLVPIDARVMKGQTIYADELTVLITHRNTPSDQPIGEAVQIPISK